MQPHIEIPVARCRPSPNARAVLFPKVLVLASSIKDVGLRQPINVRLVGADYEVRGGLHRVEAFRHLGFETIPAIVTDDDDLRAELAEIDENLIRNELSPAERAIAISRRKVCYEALHPEAAHGGDRKSSRQVGDLIEPDRKPGEAERFTKTTADATGKSERSVQRDAQRGEDIGADALAKVVNTSLDKGEELDALAKLEPAHRTRLIERAAAGEDVSAKRGDGALPNGARAIMGSRVEPDDSLDYFPTPPWATRALIEKVLRQTGRRGEISNQSAWEPACGEGHIAEVLSEYFGKVYATDIFEYGYGAGHSDFLDDNTDIGADWIITNPPFGDKTEGFVLKALNRAQVGVAMFVRLQWLESGGRYEAIFRDHPPTVIAFFAERVPLVKGRWDPEASTATAYIWLVWIKGAAPRAPYWIPPGQRQALTREDDALRFTTQPVTKRAKVVDAAPTTGCTLESPTIIAVDEDHPGIPDFLRRSSQPALPG
jgi:ParB/RepB/Spo0J family partition protein